MGLFGLGLKGKARDAVNAFSGNRDFLEGMSAFCALVAAAEGGISDAEYDQTLKVIQSNSAIAAGFGGSEIELTFGKMTPKTQTRSGRNELKDEIRQVIERDKTGKMGQALVLAGLDVADEGGISDAEMGVLRDLSTICGQNLDKLLV